MKYENVLNAFSGSVWAIDEAKMNEIIRFVESLTMDNVLEIQANAHETPKGQFLGHDLVTVNGNTAIIPIRGTIMHRANMFMNFSGGVSTELLFKAVQALEADTSIKNVVLDIDSGGGQVSGLSGLAEAIRSLRQSKNVIAVANGTMASAAYYIGSAADKVYVARDAIVGNIGTMLIHEDKSEQFKNEGRKFTIFRSSSLKGAGHPSESLTDEVKEEFNSILTALNNEFIRNVALNRNITIEEARKMADAKSHVGEDAVAKGLADGVKSVDQVVAELEGQDELEAQVEAFQIEYAALHDKYTALNTEIAGIRAELETARTSALAEKVDATVRALTEGADAKFAPMQAESLRERLMKDFNGTMAVLDLMPKGVAAPKNMPEPADVKPENTLADVIAKAKAEGKLVAADADEKETMEGFGYVEGVHFVKGF